MNEQQPPINARPRVRVVARTRTRQPAATVTGRPGHPTNLMTIPPREPVYHGVDVGVLSSETASIQSLPKMPLVVGVRSRFRVTGTDGGPDGPELSFESVPVPENLEALVRKWTPADPDYLYAPGPISVELPLPLATDADKWYFLNSCTDAKTLHGLDCAEKCTHVECAAFRKTFAPWWARKLEDRRRAVGYNERQLNNLPRGFVRYVVDEHATFEQMKFDPRCNRSAMGHDYDARELASFWRFVHYWRAKRRGETPSVERLEIPD